MGLNAAVTWDVGGIGLEGDGISRGRDRRLDGSWGGDGYVPVLSVSLNMNIHGQEKPVHTPRTGPAQTHPIRGTGLVEGDQHPSFLADSGAPEPAMCVVTTAAIDVHQPNVSSDLFSVDVPLKLGSSGTHVSTSESASHSARSSVTRAQSDSSQTLCSSADYSTTREEPSLEPSLSPPPPSPQQQVLLSSLSKDLCPSQKDSGPVPFGSPSRLCPQQSRMGAKGRSVPAGESGRLHTLSDGACHPLPVCCTHAGGEVHIFGIQRADTAPSP